MPAVRLTAVRWFKHGLLNNWLGPRSVANGPRDIDYARLLLYAYFPPDLRNFAGFLVTPKRHSKELFHLDVRSTFTTNNHTAVTSGLTTPGILQDANPPLLTYA